MDVSGGILRRLVQALAIALVVAVAVEGLHRARLLAWADNVISDTWHILRGPRVAPEELPVLLVAVDPASLDRIQDPLVFWGPRIGNAVRVLKAGGATVVGIDLSFSVTGQDWLMENGFDSAVARAWDAPLYMQVASGNTVLVTLTQDEDAHCASVMNELLHLMPSPDTHMGFANLAEDFDGVLRRFLPVVVQGPEPFPGCPRLQIATVLALHHLGFDPAAPSWEIGGHALDRHQDRMRIAWAGPRGTFPRIPIWKLLEEDALTPEERALIQGRMAIIGTENTAHHDLWFTPYDRASGDTRRRMAGYEAQANAATTLVEGWRVTELPAVARLLLLVGTGLLSAVFFSFASLRTSLATVLLQAAGWPVVGYALFRAADVLLPTASCVVVGVGVFGAVYVARFNGEVRERRHLREVFSRYVSNEVVGEILSSRAGLGLGGAKREITILFSDIRNFTSISEHLDAEEVVVMLNAWFARACPPILDRRGRVDKFIGDAVMAVFGAPVTQKDHARQALLAAVDMARAIDDFRKWVENRFRFRERGIPPFDIGVGIHTGSAVAGNIGFEKAVEYGVIGDAVNTASRLEGQSKVLGVRILASRQTLDQAGPGFQTGKSARVIVKGRAEPVEVVEILGHQRRKTAGRDRG